MPIASIWRKRFRFEVIWRAALPTWNAALFVRESCRTRIILKRMIHGLFTSRRFAIGVTSRAMVASFGASERGKRFWATGTLWGYPRGLLSPDATRGMGRR